MGGRPADLAGLGVGHAGAAVDRGVGVEHLHVLPHRRAAKAVVLIGVGAEVDGADELAAGLVPAQEHHHVVAVVVRHQPLEALPVKVDLPQGALLLVEEVDILDILLELAVFRILQQLPVQLPLIVPLLLRAQLHAHEAQLLAGVGHGVGVEAPDPGKLLPAVPGHLAQHGALHVDHLVVAEGEDIVLREGVEHGEGDVLMVALAEPGVHLQIVAHVVHPAHVPLEVEAQTANVGGLGHQRPGGGFLRHHQHVRIDGEGGLVELLEELNGLQVLLAAVFVGDPLAVVPVVVQIQHGGHRVHPDAVDVVLLEPEGGGGEQEALHLGPAVVKDPGSPGGVLALAGVLVLVAGAAVELVEAVLILAEVGGHPVQNDADAGLVHPVDEVHKVLRCAVAGGGGEVAGALVAPAGVIGVLGDGQQLDVVEAHLLDVGGQPVRQVPVADEVTVLLTPPGAQVDLVDVQRGAVDLVAVAIVQPLAVTPLVPL